MKLFAPRNDGGWSIADPNSWWPMQGQRQTVAGKMVSEDSALCFSAVCSCTRVISETLARLPFEIKEQVDARTTKKMVKHPLWNILRHEPNPEQDKACFMDMQVALQLNWGNAYSEVQRDQIGNVVALWPIHPSRIPAGNITRNEQDPFAFQQIMVERPGSTVGSAGEIVYWVRNDDASFTPIPASEMLHVPGILSRNGITGQSIIRLAANSIGIGMATEEHAGALFKNGAVTNMVIKSPKIVGKETADRLRRQWQATFAGADNHYKTLLLEDGMEPVPVSMKPEDTQLILARQFSVTEIARWYRVPPHMIGDLTRATFSNIEQQSIDFVQHCLDPWLVRWQEALFRQLLSPKEKLSLFFEFDLSGLLKGDSAARAAYFQFKFNTGSASPNDIRAADGENPVDGGDTYFVQGNNYIPLDKAQEMAQANIDKAKAPPPAPQAPAAPPQNSIADELASQREFIEGRIASLSGTVTASVSSTIEAVAGQFGDKIGEIAAIIPAALEKSVSTFAERVSTSMAEVPEIIAAAMTPLVEAQQRTETAVAKMPEELSKLIPPAPEPPDTAILEAVAVREAELAKKQAEIDEKLRKEREITDKVLILAVKRGIDGLTLWESKAIEKAIEKPSDWADWRGKFYQRFVKQFVHDLTELVPEAEACGVALDAVWGADRYAGASIADLKTLDDAANDNFHDRLKECCDHFRKRQWVDRSKVLAAEMVERGRQLFKEGNRNA